MAKFSFKGIDELDKAIHAASKMPQFVLTDMLKAMAEILKEQIPKSASALGVGQKFGQAFLNALWIKPPKGSTIEVTFKGSRSDYRHRGVREAEIGFLNEFGVPSKHMGAKPFMQDAMDQAGDQMVSAGEEIFNKWLDSIGL